MTSFTTPGFREMLAQLPVSVRRQAGQAYRLFRENPAHPGLHFKQVHADPPTYSARVGIGYRAVALVDGDEVVWFWIGTMPDTTSSCSGSDADRDRAQQVPITAAATGTGPRRRRAR